MRSLWTDATRAGERERLRTLRDLDAAALQLREACPILLDSTHPDPLIREKVYEQVAQDALVQACALVGELARPAEEEQQYQQLLGKYTTLRTFLPTLLRSVTFQATPAGRPILEAVAFLKHHEGHKNPPMDEAPRTVIPRSWRRHVIEREGKEEHINRKAYTLCVAERLQEALRRHEVFVAPSERWSDPRAKLLQGAAWEAVRGQVCQTLGRSEKASESLSTLQTELHTAYQHTLANFAANTAIRIEQKDGQDHLILTPLDRLEEPKSLLTLRGRVNRRLPPIDLPEVVLEIHAQTNLASGFTHVSDGNARAENLPLSICAVLIAEACNVGLTPVVNPNNPALAYDRLTWVQQNFIRAETLSRANAMLVDAQAKLTLAQAWGGGEVASADGLRFIVPVRTINAGYNSKYFGVGRGVTYYNFTSDQFSGFNAIVIPGTIRDSLYILEGLLEQQTSLNPIEIMADTAGTSDLVFGLFWLLGYQFSPRIADIGGVRFWRMDAEADYGPLNGLARHRINSELISSHWDDMLRVAGSLKLGTVHATDLMRALQRGGHPSALARAIGEVGRIAKSLYLLCYIDDENYRRKILTQLNRGEGRHAVARVIFHGQRGELRQRYREGQEDQLGALGLILNAVILWNTIYMQDALEALRTSGKEVLASDVARLSPLVSQHINFSGKYHFDLPDMLAAGQHRPLRTPDQPDDEP
jgi:TnpA family transposase